MATVPISKATVDPTAITPGYQSDAGVTGAAFGSLQAAATQKSGAALGGVSDELAQRALVAQQFDNERALKQADVTLADKIRTITYGDGTADNPGYYAQRGDNAVANAKPTMDAIAKAKDDVLSSLTNPRVQAMFGDAAQARVTAEQRTVGSFLDQQRKVADDGASLARMDAASADAATRWNEPNVLSNSFAINAAEVTDFAARNGLSPDAKDAMLRAQNGKLITSVVKTAGRADPDAAMQIMDQAQKDGSVPGEVLAGLERELRIDQSRAKVDQRMQEEEARRQLAQQQQDTGDRLYKSLFSTGSLVVPPNFATTVANAGLKWETAKALTESAISMSNKENNTPTTPGLLNDTLTRSLLPDGDPRKTTQAELFSYVNSSDPAKNMTTKDASFALDNIKKENIGQTQTIKDAVIDAQNVISPNHIPGMPTAAESSKFSRFDAWFYPKLQEGIANGKSVSQLLNAKDKENYLLTPENMDQFKQTLGGDVAGPTLAQRFSNTAAWLGSTGVAVHDALVGPTATPGSSQVLAPKAVAPPKAGAVAPAGKKQPLGEIFGDK